MIYQARRSKLVLCLSFRYQTVITTLSAMSALPCTCFMAGCGSKYTAKAIAIEGGRGSMEGPGQKAATKHQLASSFLEAYCIAQVTLWFLHSHHFHW